MNGSDPTGRFFLSDVGAAFSVHSVLATASIGASFAAGFGFGDGVVNNGVFHSYTTESTICTRSSAVNDPCTFENVFVGLKLFPAPGSLGIDPVYDGKKSHVTFLGSVVHSVSKGTVRNTTLPNHLLDPGFVDRTVKSNGSTFFIETHGEGSGRFPIFNSLFSDVLWKSWDTRITNFVEGSK